MDKIELSRNFELVRGQLKSYILRMTASVQDTEDLVQDTWIKANEKLDTFKAESTLKTWIFSIASNLTIDYLRKRKRWPENVTDICKEAFLGNPAAFQSTMEIAQSSPHAKFEVKEHIAFCFTCISKSLPIEQHLCLLLKEVYDFKIKEISIILRTTDQLVKYHLHTSRQKMVDLFEGRCALINQKGVCHQCSEMNGLFNPKQKIEEELVKIKMVRDAKKVDKQRLFDLRLEILKGIDPFTSNAHELQLHHLEHNRIVMEEHLKKNG